MSEVSDMSELQEMYDHVEHMLITFCKYMENDYVGIDINNVEGLEEVAEWWGEYQKTLPQNQTKEMKRLAAGLELQVISGTVPTQMHLKKLIELVNKAEVK